MSQAAFVKARPAVVSKGEVIKVDPSTGHISLISQIMMLYIYIYTPVCVCVLYLMLSCPEQFRFPNVPKSQVQVIHKSDWSSICQRTKTGLQGAPAFVATS